MMKFILRRIESMVRNEKKCWLSAFSPCQTTFSKTVPLTPYHTITRINDPNNEGF